LGWCARLTRRTTGRAAVCRLCDAQTHDGSNPEGRGSREKHWRGGGRRRQATQSPERQWLLLNQNNSATCSLFHKGTTLKHAPLCTSWPQRCRRTCASAPAAAIAGAAATSLSSRAGRLGLVLSAAGGAAGSCAVSSRRGSWVLCCQQQAGQLGPARLATKRAAPCKRPARAVGGHAAELGQAAAAEHGGDGASFKGHS
jgi:hypothetical protein